MASETILCAESSESLIIAEKQHEKETNVAQKIQEECDKKFHNGAVDGEHAETQITNGNDIVVDADGSGEEKPLQNGNHHEHDAHEPDEKDEAPLDSLNVNGSNDEVKDEHIVDKVAEHVEEKQLMAETEVAIEIKAPEIVEEADISMKQNSQNEIVVETDDAVVTETVAESQKEEHVAPPSPVVTIAVECEPIEGQQQKQTKQMAPRVIEEEMKAQKETVPNGPRKNAIATSMDTESVRDAYNDIRADNSETRWAVFKYEASRIICSAKGVAFDEFKQQFDDDERAYGYIRLQTGDEMSKRHKFLFVTWIGPGVSVLKRAKMSIDKAIIKNVVSNFAVELQLETLSEFDLPFFIESLNKASGANYGTGVRDI